ncbi:EamA family transporter [Psychrobacter phenylpyruvicus]|nr:EamA family transporter [Psychrobacter phenylpyruvicus]
MLAPIFWGTTYVVTTQFLPTNLPLFAAVIRVLPAGIILILMSRKLPQSGQWGRILILSFLNISCFQALLFVAAYRLPGGIAAIVSGIQPLIIMTLLWQVNRIAPRPITLTATITTIMGMALLLINPNSSWDIIGLIAALLGAVSMAFGIYLTKLWKPNVSNLTFTGWQLLFGGVMLLPLALFLETFPTSLSINNILGYAYLCIFGSLIAYALWFRGIEKLPSVAVSILGALSPITATIIGWAFLNERLSTLQAIGFILVLISVFVVQFTSKADKL